MSLRIAVAALLLAVAALPSSSQASPKATGCRGTIAGAVKASFLCSARIFTKDGVAYFSIDPAGPLEGIPGYAPGTFELPGKVAPGTWTLDDLGMGRASVAHKGGTLYTAQKTSSQRGEVKLTLKSVKPDPKSAGAWVPHGKYRARLLPAGAGKEGDVTIEVQF